ncbi:hypothetical protein [Legionella shakespearei]|uniref:Mevalonate kinase n=1 Tax=Legionella shakespearei DSM 23087 TaxID=1122169 RepID=A0A0W0YL71_9GAMM|nr:hypothetical protein [Legionella shakespearei]KTD57632.1 hypothetical protein Lsha_2473 [Legionella shakespearei DSM 23087]
MKWRIPAKTFLLGEYAAIAEASAIILTTTPCFELSLKPAGGISKIHPQSPAGLWWQQQNYSASTLSWVDPYKGKGGLGASSAQFLACYLASCHVQNKTPDMDSMLAAYYQSAWSGEGLRPSGYDVIAQSQSGCVFINRQKKVIQSSSWPFKDLSFLLLHTGIKLATHHHLKESTLPERIDYLSHLVDLAQKAFEHEDSQLLIQSITDYHQALTELNLVAQHSQDFIRIIKSWPETKAIKGCGAMGADILLVLTEPKHLLSVKRKARAHNLMVLATEKELAASDKYIIV